MKNLKLTTSLCYTLLAPNLKGAQLMSVDYDTGQLYFMTGADIVVIDPHRKALCLMNCLSLKENGFLTSDFVIGIQYLPDQCSLCLSVSNGDVLLWNTQTDGVECMGSVSSGLKAMGWSPDHELVVLVTGDDQVSIMNREFDPVIETELHPDEFGEAEFVNVGWGKKETQFHGSAGKQAAKVTPTGIEPAPSTDDGKTRVSWRGDGQYFAISSVNPRSQARVIRTWCRDGSLHSTSEIINGLEHPLAWKPLGSLIATTQKLPDKHVVRFLERNGLMHGEFTLPFSVDSLQICELLWNRDSSILLVWARNTIDKSSVVQLWTVNNYHWYLKQSIVEKDVDFSIVEWDPERVDTLHIVDVNGRYLCYQWTWSICRSHSAAEDDLATVAVIDGEELLLTPFRKVVIPPPMSAYQIKAGDPIYDVTWSPSSNHLAALTCNHLLVYEVTPSNDGDGIIKVNKILQLPISFLSSQLDAEVIYPCMFHHATLLKSDRILLVLGHSSEIYDLFIDNEPKLTNSCSVRDSIIAVCCTLEDEDTLRIAAQMDSGEVFEYNTTTGTTSPWITSTDQRLAFPQPCFQMEITSLNKETVVLGLTERYRFYVDNAELATNCTSFCVHDEFVLLTTHAHTCRCIHRSISLNDLALLSDGKAHPFDESIRRVERGSHIVTAVAHDTKLVLQMPRGNLETIHPRALVLFIVRQHLENSRYDLAFTLMKKHRINMNLIHDHNPEKFLRQTDLLIQQLKTSDNINLFLTELQNDDVTRTMYDMAYKTRNLKTEITGQNKVDEICNTVRKSLIAIDEDKLFLSVLTTYVKKNTPELELALHSIQKLKKLSSRVKIDDALKYLLYLVDVNQLYDVALGTYDFDLVLMVAEKSQKDPKEYLPLLNDLRSMDDNYRKYSIDQLLRRFDKALVHIVACGDGKFDECLSLIQSHNLYPQAMTLYSPTSLQFKQIAEAHGTYLHDKRHYEEAGLAYWKAENWQMAIEMFKKSLSWRQCFSMANAACYTPEALNELAREMAEALKNDRRQQEAAVVYLEYANDIEEAIATLIAGEQWTEALRIIYKNKRLDFIETNLKPALVETHSSYTLALETHQDEFNRYFKRLLIVRTLKQNRSMDLLDEATFNNADADLYSDISSATGQSVISSRSGSSSVYSRSSARSGRNRRKAERKKWSLKEGSQQEDLALVDALQKIIQQVEQSKEEIGALLRMLVLFNYGNEAHQLQKLLVETFDLVQKHLAEIWLQDEVADTTVLGPGSTANTLVAMAAQRGRQILKTAMDLEPTLRNPPLLGKDRNWKLHAFNT